MRKLAILSLLIAVFTANAYASEQLGERRFQHIDWREEVYTAERRLAPVFALIAETANRAAFTSEAAAIFDPFEQAGTAARFASFRDKWRSLEPQAVTKLEQDFDGIRDYLYEEMVIRPWWYNPQPLDDIQQAANLPYRNYMLNRPNVRVEAFSPLRMAGADYQAPILMSIASRNSPEILGLFIHMIRTYAEQGLIAPLDEYIGYDLDGDGLVDDSEAIWEPWKHIPDNIKLTCMHNGRIYAIPNDITYSPVVVIYRRDLFAEAGLDPNRPPKTWEEFLDYSRRLTRPHLQITGARFQMGRRGFFVRPASWMWYPWFWSAGGNLVMQERQCSSCNTKTKWTKEEIHFECSGCDEVVIHDSDGNMIESDWKATFADEAGAAALEFYQQLRWEWWYRCGDCDEPVILDRNELAPLVAEARPDAVIHSATCPKCNHTQSLTQGDITEGSIRVLTAAEGVDRVEAFENGEVAMMMWYLSPGELSNLALRPDQIGVFPMPVRKPGDKPWTVAQPTYSAMAVELDSQAKIDATWDLMAARYSYRTELTQAHARAGYYRFMSPHELRLANLGDFVDELPEWWVENLNTAFEYTRTEPFQPNASYIQDQVFQRHVFDRIFNDPDFNAVAALQAAQEEANTKFLSKEFEEHIERLRPIAMVVVIVAALGLMLLLGLYIRAASKQYGLQGSSGQSEKQRILAPLLLLTPAVLSIALWSYYPLVRGSIMAFQDFRILGGTRWVGIDNFLRILYDQQFYEGMFATIRYVMYALSLGFLAPITLAILLTEVPLGKYLFRTIFYLPAVMSSLVVMFLWKLMYNETHHGFLNRVFMNETFMNFIKGMFFTAVGLLVIFAIRNIISVIKANLNPKTADDVEDGLLELDDSTLMIRQKNIAGRKLRTAVLELFIAYLLLIPLFGLRITWPVSYVFPWFGWSLGPWLVAAREPIKWLTSEAHAMRSVILPFVWAGAGPACLIYLAALKSVPEDLYEAADVDGAGIWSKLRHITLPTLRPLIIINFVGATIGAFQSMQNILVMTGGANKTRVIGLVIWQEAYVYLRFGYATALAWILGSLLIGFTVLQLNVLRKVEFRKAEEN